MYMQSNLALTTVNQTVDDIDEFKILLVEDTPLIQRVHSLMLKQIGYQFDIAANGQETLNKLTKNKYALILLDIGLPDIDGIEICKLIRSMKQYSHIPVIALTAYSRECVEVDCLDAGINEVATKPIKIHGLEQLLKKYLINKM